MYLENGAFIGHCLWSTHLVNFIHLLITQYESMFFCNPCGFKDCGTVLWTVVIYAGAVTVM